MVKGGKEKKRKLIFREIGGIWKWGEGRIGMKVGEDVELMKREKYLKKGKIKGVIVYKIDIEKLYKEELENVMRREGMERIEGSMESIERWERVMKEEERK